jgi:hypothetical protein
MRQSRAALLLATLSLGAGLSLAYVPDCGHGFMKDDFRWIVESRVTSVHDLGRLLLSDNGFYRPVVSLTFAANAWLFRGWARGYALTNFAILSLCCVALFALGRGLKMEPGVALFAVALWALNPHGISALVMWISGRTSGLATLFSLLAAVAMVRRRRFLAAALCFLALISKEEAFFLPFVLTAWAGWSTESKRWSPRLAIASGWPAILTLVPYLVLRSQTGAYLPMTAPPYYRPTFDLRHLGRNVIEYADRSATFTAAVLLALLLVVRRARRMETDERTWILLGLLWLIGGFGLTVFVPPRSSLYACLPSVGTALAGAAVARCLWSRATPLAQSRLLMVALLVPLALVPLLRSRHSQSRSAADLSASVLAQLATEWPSARPGITIVLQDDPGQRPNLREVFGTLLEPALALQLGRALPVEYLPSRHDWTEARILVPGDPTLTERRFRLQEGRLVSGE